MRLRLVLLFLVALLATVSPASTAAAATTDLKISEFRVRGTNGANDEFVEIRNVGVAPHTVIASSGTGYALAASNGIARFVVPNGTIIPAGGHYLGVNSVGYSIAAYPAGSGLTATGDATYTSDIPDNAGIALFDTTVPASFTLANRIDAVGAVAEANTLYKEGTGYSTLTPFSIDYSFYRDLRSGRAKDTDSNAADFTFVDTNGTSAGAGQRLGAPGPENASSPRSADLGGLDVDLADPTAAATAPPNLVRDFTSDPGNNSTFGTVTVRRKITNNGSTTLTRLRLRVSDVTTFPSPSGTADLRPRTTGNTVVVIGGSATNVLGTTLEQAPSQPNGGGFNSSMSVNVGAGIAPGSSILVQVLLGLQQTGDARICGVLESGPDGESAPVATRWDTDGGAVDPLVASCSQVEATDSALSPSGNALGEVPVTDAASTRTVTILNTGGEATRLTGATITGADSNRFTLSGGTCATIVSLRAGASCSFLLSFDAVAPGAASADLAFNSTGAAGGTTSVPLTATGVESAATASATSLVFGTRAVDDASTEVQAVTFINSGAAPLVVSGVTIGGLSASAFAVVAENCTSTPVARTGTCAVSVRFDPSTAGVHTAVLSLATNAPGGSTLAFLVGVGTPACVATRTTGCSRADRMRGSAKADTIRGLAGNDTIFGLAGNDKLFGDADNDVLDGGLGNDALNGGAGTDVLRGGAGTDTINARSSEKDTVDCGTGLRDVAVVDRLDAVNRNCEVVRRR